MNRPVIGLVGKQTIVCVCVWEREASGVSVSVPLAATASLSSLRCLFIRDSSLRDQMGGGACIVSFCKLD